MTTDRGDAATEETVAVDTIKINQLSPQERRALRDLLFTDVMKGRVQRLTDAGDSVRRAANECASAVGELADSEESRIGDEYGTPSRDQLIAALHTWHDAYHSGAFRLCREPQCADLGVGTAGPAEQQLTVTA